MIDCYSGSNLGNKKILCNSFSTEKLKDIEITDSMINDWLSKKGGELGIDISGDGLGNDDDFDWALDGTISSSINPNKPIIINIPDCLKE